MTLRNGFSVRERTKKVNWAIRTSITRRTNPEKNLVQKSLFEVIG
jgi:hypothetical protein